MNRTYRHNSELHFVGNVQLALLQDLAEVEEHPGIPVHTLDEAEAVAYGSNHALERRGIILRFSPKCRRPFKHELSDLGQK